MILNKVLYANITVLDLIVGLAVLIVSVFLAKIVSLYISRLLREKVKREKNEIIIKVVYYLIVLLGLLIALPFLGVKPSGLIVAGGIVGIAIGFASQSIVSNFISGVFLLIERPIRIGNSVNIDGSTGIVEDIRIMSTTLRTFDGLFIRIPNQKVFTSNIINYETNIARRFEYKIGIRYSDDADKAIQIIKDVIENESMALVYPEPLIFVSELGDNAVNIIVRPWAPVSEWYKLYSTLLWKLKSALKNEGIEIPFPQRVLWFPEKLQTEQSGPPQ